MGAWEDREGGKDLGRMAAEEDDECARVQEEMEGEGNQSEWRLGDSRGGESNAGLCW